MLVILTQWQSVKDWSEGSVPEYTMRSAFDMAANFMETLDEKSKTRNDKKRIN